MAFKRAKARIGERSTTSGSGPWTLGGAFDSSYNTFSSFLSDGDTTEISVVEPGVAVWTGIGTYTASGNSIAATTVEETFGTFGAGTKEIFAGALAARALLKEDMAGAIVTGGTSTAYTVSSFRVYDTLTRLHGNAVAFTPHTTNGQTVTLNVDGLGAKPLRLSPGVELQSNTLIQGTPYTALYSNVDGAFYLHALSAGNTYGVPLGAGLDYWGATTPSSAFVFPVGQALSRTIYAALFSLIGTTYGSGDGSTTFNLQDLRGRVAAMLDGGTGRLPGYTGLGVASGQSTNALGTGNLPPYTPSGSISVALSNPVVNIMIGGAGGAGPPFSSNPAAAALSAMPAVTVASQTFTGNAQGGSSSPFTNVQPTIACNYIMRVI